MIGQVNGTGRQSRMALVSSDVPYTYDIRGNDYFSGELPLTIGRHGKDCVNTRPFRGRAEMLLLGGQPGDGTKGAGGGASVGRWQCCFVIAAHSIDAHT